FTSLNPRSRAADARLAESPGAHFRAAAPQRPGLHFRALFPRRLGSVSLRGNGHSAARPRPAAAARGCWKNLCRDCGARTACLGVVADAAREGGASRAGGVRGAALL